MVRFINFAAVLLVVSLVSVAVAQSTASFDLSGLATQTTTDITSVFTTLLPVMIAATALLVAWKYAKRIGRGV
jgi:protein-S-isoprenylcysteine O-methyltransferase Ste14